MQKKPTSGPKKRPSSSKRVNPLSQVSGGSHKGINPRTKEEIKIPAHPVPVFK